MREDKRGGWEGDRILKHVLTLSTPSTGIGGGMGLDVLTEAKTDKESTRLEDGENIIFFINLVLMFGLMMVG